MQRNETTATSTVLLNGEQAKNQLEILEAKAKSLRKSLKESSEVGDMAGWKKYNKELTSTQREMKKVRSEAFDAKKVLDNLSGSSLKDLYSAQKKIDSLLKNGTVKRNSAEWKELADQQKLVKTEISKVNAEMSIGESKWAKFTGGFGKMFAGLAIGGAILSGLKSWYNSMVEFGTAVSQLSAITGATGKDLDFLKNKAKELGAEYGKSATEIVEAMKLVGSAKPELLENAAALSEMTESVLVLAKASGMELSDTTQSLATIMNQFGLSASEANRVINTLAAGSKYGAVEVDYLSDSIAKVGAVAASAGLNLEQTVAVMELFGEKGIKAEIAGTGLKSLLVELQKDTRNYTNGVFDLNKAIDNNQNIAGNNIKLTEKFGKEYFNLAQILFQNKERFIELNEQVKSTNTAFEQYAVATDNLRGDMDKLTGSWNAFILSLEDGKGPIANAFRSLIQYINEAVGGMERLSKDSNQRKASSTSKIVDIRIDSFKKELSKEKNQIKYINQEIIAEKNLIKRKAERIEYIKKDIEERERLGGAWDDNNDKFQAELDGLQLAKDRSIAYVNALGGLRAEMTKVNKVVDETETKEPPDLNNTNNTDKNKKKKTPYEINLVELEADWKDAELINKKAYADETVNEEVFREWQYQAKLEFLAKKLALDKKYKKDTTATEAEIADAIISENEYWNNKIIQEAEKLKKDEQKNNKDKEREVKEHLERIAQIRREFGLNTLRLTYSQELELLKEKLAEEKASEEETAMAIADFKKRVAEDYVNDYATVAAKASAALNNLVEMETIAIETKYAKEIEAAEKAGQDTTAITEKIEEEKKAIKKKYAGIDFAITSAKIVAETALAIMKASGNIPLQIAEGILGVTQLGIATAEFEKVKNLWTGGFTDPGDKYKPAGIVHAGEFVANQDAVGNRTLRRLFNVIDYAQKNNTVGRIDSSTIARALQMKQGFSSGGFTAPGTATGADVQVINYAEVVSALHSANAVNSALLAELQKGIRAKVAIRGSEGLEETTELYDKLMTNVKKK